MDNFGIDITSDGEADLEHALAIVFNRTRRAVGYRVVNAALVLYWSTHETAVVLPFELTAVNAVAFVLDWLAAAGDPPEPAPDLDGSVSVGWRLWNNGWGQATDLHEWEAFIQVRPTWALHGK